MVIHCYVQMLSDAFPNLSYIAMYVQVVKVAMKPIVIKIVIASVLVLPLKMIVVSV